MIKIFTAISISIIIVTIIPNLILAYKYFILKKYEDSEEVGMLHFICLYFFSVFTIILIIGKLTLIIFEKL